MGAPTTTGNASDTERRETTPRERVQITLPALTRVEFESGRRVRIVRDESRTHLFTNLEMLLPDRRAEPRNKLCRRNTQVANGFLQHAASQPTPTRMRRTDGRPITRRKQHGHTVRNLNHTHAAKRARHGGIRAQNTRRQTRRLGRCARAPRRRQRSLWSFVPAPRRCAPHRRRRPHIQIRHLNPVHLLQPHRLPRQPQPFPHTTPVLLNRSAHIPNMSTNIE